MKIISQLRNEIAARTITTEGIDNFGEQLVNRLLSMNEIDMVAGGDYPMCGGSGTSYTMSGGSSYIQSGSGTYTQSGGSYSMAC